MKSITLTAPCGKRFRFRCDDVINGVAINPVLPPRFDNTTNELRSDQSRAWWGVPFVVIRHDYNPQFVKHWKGNTRYDVRCVGSLNGLGNVFST